MQISKHFTLEELPLSQAAKRHGLDNTPNPTATANLVRVAEVMEKIRTILGDNAIVVYSGYRALLVNKTVGGAATSAHCRGLACDFVSPAFGTPIDVALAIFKSNLEYDQLILEYGWVHIGLAEEGSQSRQQALTKRSQGAPYEPGIRV